MDIIVRKNYATPFFLREPFDTDIAKVGHCNRIIEALNTIDADFTALDGEVATLQAQVTALQAEVDALPTPFTLPYKIYTAIINQTGTDAPTVTVLQNTLGGTLVWSRVSVGYYRGTLTGAFPDQNKSIMFNGGNYNDNSSDINGFWDSANAMYLLTTSGGLLTDGLLTQTPVEIRVYA